jgi:Lrp/AsnC family leucine-responsive transcriptional regulator
MRSPYCKKTNASPSRMSLRFEPRDASIVALVANTAGPNGWNMPNMKLDAIDRRILTALQEDGRLTNVELSDRVGLSPSPTLRRVKLLEDVGVIRGYRAVLDRPRVNLGLTLFVNISAESREDIETSEFLKLVVSFKEVVSCHLVSGESDFLLEVVVPDLAAYDNFLVKKLLKVPGIKAIRSNFVIRTIKPQGPLMLDHLAEDSDA